MSGGLSTVGEWDTRACIFNLDGLLINKEDLNADCVNAILARYGRPRLTSKVRAQLTGVPDSTNGDIFHDWAKLSISREEFTAEYTKESQECFLACQPMHGARELLLNLSRAYSAFSGERMLLSLASSTTHEMFQIKVSQEEIQGFLGYFRQENMILGDDPRVPPGRAKPAPDIYLTALQSLNMTRGPDEAIQPDQCLVFEDSPVGVEAARRAGMRVVWVPHPELADQYDIGRNDAISFSTGAVHTGQVRRAVSLYDSMVEVLPSLQDFSYDKYGIVSLAQASKL
ncbi:HAD-like protein [Penicillium nucicola]|uniref:HAD-like protein n=1 Tax=Penicillium nucicola TaxID=1850975 RepID=UPI0025450B2E|nr:HAD-like protein [Penicillium nucicola]KAJ5751503.1 HAD-like protein [Penicillium nucicola]